MNTTRLTTAQATVRYLAGQFVGDASQSVPYFAGVWAIFHLSFQRMPPFSTGN